VPFKKGQAAVLLAEVNCGYVGFNVLTAVVVKNTIFSDITPCSPLKVSQRFFPKRRLTFNRIQGIKS
jgi:vancomycin permeability regulator SanA